MIACGVFATRWTRGGRGLVGRGGEFLPRPRIMTAERGWPWLTAGIC